MIKTNHLKLFVLLHWDRAPILFCIIQKPMNHRAAIAILSTLLFLGVLCCPAQVCPAQSSIVTGQLTSTSQINPNQLNVLGAGNLLFTNHSSGLAGNVNGVVFDDVNWGNSTTLSTGVTLLGSLVGSRRDANTALTISGANDTVLESVVNSINFYGFNTSGTLTFSNLTAGERVIVQLITSDEASNRSNWAGVNELSIVDTTDLSVNTIGSYQAGTEPNATDAQLATFDALVDGNGNLQIGVLQTAEGQNFGVSGVVLLQAVPEPSSGLLLLAAGLLLVSRRKKA